MLTIKNFIRIKISWIIIGCFLILFLFAQVSRASSSCPYGPGSGSCFLGTCDGVCCGSSCCEGSCGCTPNCTGKTCGGDGCGGSCGTCAAGQNCTGGSCVTACTPNCIGKVCGSDGCGGSCGTCQGGTNCLDGMCVSAPTTCTANQNCTTADGCAGVATCFAGMLLPCVKNDLCCNVICPSEYACSGGECVKTCTGCATAPCGGCSSLKNGYECICSGSLGGAYTSCTGSQTPTCVNQSCCQKGSNGECCFHVVNGNCVAVGGTQTQFCSQCPPAGSLCGTNGMSPCSCGCAAGLSSCLALSGGYVCLTACPANKYTCDSTNKICYINASGTYASYSDCVSACAPNKCGCDSNNQPTCSASGTGASCASASECTCAPKTCNYTTCECSGGSCSTVTKSGTVPCQANQSCKSCPAYNTCDKTTRTCSETYPAYLTLGSCQTGCKTNAECGLGQTKDCSWKECSNNTCSLIKKSTIPSDQTCPTGCFTNNDCTIVVDTAVVVINGSCQNGSAAITSQVSGGNLPYSKYTWYKDGVIDYEQVCPTGSSGCTASHTYTGLGTSTHQVYLRIEDAKGLPWASNILGLNCAVTANKCGIDANGAIFCSASGTGAPCNSVADCTSGPCPLGQVNPHSVCTPTTCNSVAGCGVNECADDTDCSGSSCTINSFNILPLNRTILLGGSFKASWGTTDCTSCNLSCSPLNCGKQLPASVPTETDIYAITPTKSGSYNYTLECSDGIHIDTRKLGVGVGDDKPFKVRNFFWKETPAFLRLLVQKVF